MSEFYCRAGSFIFHKWKHKISVIPGWPESFQFAAAKEENVMLAKASAALVVDSNAGILIW